MGSTPTAPTKKYMSNVSRRHPQGRPKVIDFENLELGTSTDNVMFHLNMVKNDKSIDNEQVVLYLGGRIDDDALYPKSYCSYLNSKIKELNPTKIIAHTPWYAKKYYDKVTKHSWVKKLSDLINNNIIENDIKILLHNMLKIEVK